jgi:hypothetical protein
MSWRTSRQDRLRSARSLRHATNEFHNTTTRMSQFINLQTSSKLSCSMPSFVQHPAWTKQQDMETGEQPRNHGRRHSHMPWLDCEGGHSRTGSIITRPRALPSNDPSCKHRDHDVARKGKSLTRLFVQKPQQEKGTCSCDVVANRNDNAAPLPPASSTPNVLPIVDESREKRRRR